MAIRFSLASKNARKPVATEAATGCSKDDVARLEGYAASLRSDAPPGPATRALHRAIEQAKANLPDPCEDGRLLNHLMGMSALLQLVHLRANLAPETAKMLPQRGAFEESVALTAERVFRRVTVPLAGLRAAAEAGEPRALGKLATLLETLNILSPVAQTLRDTATSYVAFSAANGVGLQAGKEAAAIAASLGRPGAALGFAAIEPGQLRAMWDNIDVSTRLAVVTSKTKERALQDDGTRATIFKTLTTSRGHVYRLQAPLTDRTGAHGRVYPADAESDSSGAPLIVKVQRTQRKLAGRQDTLDTPLAKLLDSAAAQADATARVNAGLEAHAHLFEEAAGPLRFLDARGSTTAVTDQFVDASGKFYQVMRAMAGDLADVSRSLSAQVGANKNLEPVVARARLSVATQAALQLEGLHKRQGFKDGGMTHLDLKLPNIVFDEQGIVRIIDFDEAKTLSILGRVRDGSHVGGSLSSPERGNAVQKQQGKPLSKPYDVWCLAAAMLELGTPTFYDETETGPRAVNVMLDRPAQAPRTFGTHEYFAVYGSIWQQHIRGSSAFSGVPLVPSAHERTAAVRHLKALSAAARHAPQAELEGYVDLCYARLSRFVTDRLQADPELTTLLFRMALAPAPKERSSAKVLAAALIKLMARQTAPERLEVRQLFASLARRTPLTGVR